MDIDLGPGMDGTEAAKEIQKIRDIPIVFLSSHIEKAIVDRTEAITSYGYVVKNTGITVLAASIKMAFRLHEAHLSIREKSMEIEAANEELRITIEELERTNEELTLSQRELMEREQAIAEREAMFSAAFRSNPDPVALTEIGTGRIIDLNPAFEAWSGYSRDEIIGRTTRETGLWARQEDRDAMVSELHLHGMVKDMDVLLRNRSGAVRTAQFSAQTMKVGGAHVLYTRVHDVTDARVMEAALRESEEKNRAMLNSIPDLMFMLDSDGVFIDWKGPEETLAMSPDLFIGKSIRDVMPGIAGLVMERIQALGTDRSLEIIEYDLEMGGEIRSYEARMVPAGEGRVMSMVRDITERKRTEAALRARDEQIRVIFETSQAGIILVSPEGRITLANRSMAEMLRCPMDELINSFYPDHLHPDQHDAGEDLMRQLIRGEIDQVYTERHYLRADGSDFWGYLAGRRYEDQDGKILSLIGIINDITGLRQAEEQAARNISFLERLESVEKIIRRARDLETMMMDLLDTVRVMFGADRAWLLYPCDPEWPSFQVRMIRTNERFAIDLKSDDNLPITGDTAAVFRELLTSDEVMAFDPRTKRNLPYGPEFGTRSQVSVALYPKMSKPWVFGLHQCSHDRTWTDEELRLFNDIGRRIADGLSSMLLLHTLRENEDRLRALINNMPDIVCFKDGSGRWLEANDFDLRLFQIEGVDYHGKKDSELAAFSSFYRDAFLTCEGTDEEAWKKGTVSRGDETIPRPDGTSMVFDIIKVPTFNPDGSRKGLVVVGRDITERKRIEEALEKRLVAMTKPLEDAGTISFEELFNIEDIQLIQDLFSSAAEVASIITHVDGTPITTPSNFCRLCNGIIRQTEKGLANCYHSDAILGRYHPEGPVIQQCLSGGLWDAGASITVGGHHIANWLIGQVRNEAQSDEAMRGYARDIGVDEEAFMEAFREVPTMSRERFEVIAQTLFVLANQLSLRAYQNVQQARFITERTAAEEELKKTAMEKSVLLVELQHRVKNNLGIITSLLNLEMGALNDERSRKVFQSAISRIQSMSTIYEQLYQSSGIDRINLKHYIEDITRKIYNTYTIVPGHVRLKLDLEDITIDLKRSVPIGLILNELVTNSLKYAYPDGREGDLRINLEAVNGSIGITVSDDGAGLPDNFRINDIPSMGLRLVEMLVDQIDGTLTMDSNAGTTVRITCPA